MKTSERLNLHQQNHSKPINKITVKSVMNGKASMNNVVIDETEKTTGNDLTDEESLLKLKLILKTISVSSFYYNKTVLSKKSFENLVKLQNYENTLNCKLQTCLYEVHDINDYLLKEIDKNDIKTILNRYSSDSHIAGLGSTLNYDKTASHTEKQFSHNEIQSDPYYYNEHSSDGINSIRRSRHPKKMLNKKISTNQTLNEEIKSCNCANNSCLNLKKVDASSSPNHDSTDSKTQLFKSDVPLNSSHYCVNSGNKIVENENEKQKEVYNRNLNVLRDRNKILPEEKSIIKSKSLLNISSSKSKIDRTKIPPVLGLAQDQLSNEANDCQRYLILCYYIFLRIFKCIYFMKESYKTKRNM